MKSSIIFITSAMMTLFVHAADKDSLTSDAISSFTYESIRQHDLIRDDESIMRVLEPAWADGKREYDDKTYDKENFQEIFDRMSLEQYLENPSPLKSGDLLCRKLAPEIQKEKIRSVQQRWLHVHEELHNFLVATVLPMALSAEVVQEIGAQKLLVDYIKFFFYPLSTLDKGEIKASKTKKSKYFSSPFDARNYQPDSLVCPDWLTPHYSRALRHPDAGPTFMLLFSQLVDEHKNITRYKSMDYLAHKLSLVRAKNDLVTSLNNLCMHIVRSVDVIEQSLAKVIEEKSLSASEKRSVYLLSNSMLNYLKHNSLLHTQEQSDPEQLWLDKKFALCLARNSDEYFKRAKPALAKRVAKKLGLVQEEDEIEAEALKARVARCWNEQCLDPLRKIDVHDNEKVVVPVDQHLATMEELSLSSSLSQTMPENDKDLWLIYLEKLEKY